MGGPQLIVGVKGTAAVNIDGVPRQVSGGQAALAQAGQTLAIVNPGSDTLQVLDFAVTPLSATPTAT